MGYDNVAAMLAGGEAVTRSAIVRRVGVKFFNALNAGKIPASILRDLGNQHITGGNISGHGGHYGGGMVASSSARGSGGVGISALVADRQALDRLFTGDGRGVVEDNFRRMSRDQA